MLAEVAREATGGVDGHASAKVTRSPLPHRFLARLPSLWAAPQRRPRLEKLGQPVSKKPKPGNQSARPQPGGVAGSRGALGLEIEPAHGAGKIASSLFEALWEDRLVQPTFVYDFPTEVSPLSKQKADDPDTVERFELYAGGFEVANGFSELNDPAEQRRLTSRRTAASATPRGSATPERKRTAADGRGLPPGPRIRPAADRRRWHRHRPASCMLPDEQSASIRDVILFPLDETALPKLMSFSWISSPAAT